MTGGSRITYKGLKMSDLESYLVSAVEMINTEEGKKEKVRNWINGYRGKVIEFRTPEQDYHIVFTTEKASLRKGGYPSPEISYVGEDEVILRVLKGESRASSEQKEGNIKIRLNMHEHFALRKVLS